MIGLTLAAPAGRPASAAMPPPCRTALKLVSPRGQRLSPIALHGEGRHQATLPGEFWPALSFPQFQAPGTPIIGWWEVDKLEAVKYLIEWKHKLHEHGEPYERPFGSMFFRMDVMGRPAAVVAIASTCNKWVSKKRGITRYDAVDLARICRSPDRRDNYCLRAVLRLSREYLAPLYPLRYPKKWSVLKAVCANSMPRIDEAEIDGNTGMYRFDGFELIRVTSGKGGGGKRGKQSKVAHIGNGKRGLWLYRYPQGDLN